LTGTGPSHPASSSTASPVVGIVMGSDSDWPVMRAAAEALEEFAVPYEADVVSAHRMPRDMIEYGSSAEGRGLRVIIAGAGGAAHLPGMLASVTPLPVIGVPVPLAHLGGLDSLLSIVQMPAGIPVATVAVGGARNAGLLAVRILAAADDPAAGALRARLVSFAERLASQARAKGAALRDRRPPDLSRLEPADAGRFPWQPLDKPIVLGNPWTKRLSSATLGQGDQVRPRRRRA
jgi:5-(carboxyamino)imidazole ribonucleotide mutase